MKYTILLLSLIFGIQSCSQNSYTKYDSPKGYSFLYIDTDWEIQESTHQTFLFNKQGLEQRSSFNTNLNIIIQDLSNTPLSIEDYHFNTLKQVEQALGKDAVKSEKEIKISGNDGRELIYIMPKDIANQRMETLKLKQIYFIEKGKAYLITYTAKLNEFNNYLSSAEKVFDTFAIK